jgi:xanthine/CO dehydrogenase XdhC/CoxF family maturation factor
MAEVESELARRVERGEEAVLATVIRLDGQPPSRPGAKVLLSRATPLAGTLGCAEFDSAALADAPGLLEAGTPTLRTYRHDLGSIDVYLEPYIARPSLVVVSATPVASHLVAWAKEAGFATVLLEPRAERLGEGWKGEGNVARDLDALERAVAGDLYVVSTDHDAPDLVATLAALLRRGPRYVGVMGSRRHTGHHLEALRAQGMKEADVDRIQSPVGLDLGAQTPAEIAISILAGLIAVRRGRPGGWMDKGPER